MKKFLLIILAMIFSISILQAGTIANVIGHKDLLLTIDRGSMDGVELGMKGIVKAVYKDPSGEYPINIAVFTVKKISARTAEVLIVIGKGLNPEDASYVVFDKELVTGEPRADNSVPVKPVENADLYLEQGDKEAEAGNTKAALENYQKALALAPGNLVTKEKCNEMQKAINAEERKNKFTEYLKKADANYEKNNIKFAFLYLIEGLRIFPEGSSAVQSRMSPMAEKYPKEIEALLTEKSKELKDVRPQIETMLGKKFEAKPMPTEAKTPETKYNEPSLQGTFGKPDKIYKNEKGFWEAVFLKNITMIYIPEGQFTIGSPEGEGDADEHPAHKVFLSGYWIGKTEVTFAQYDAFCQETGLAKPQDEGWGRGERPVINVSWTEAKNFCAWLEKKTGFSFRLPTEAEWERAARDRYPWGNTPPANNLANFGKAIMKTNTVGSYPEGASYYGVLDLAGNVWEWLADWYDADYYNNSAENDPQGPESGTEKVVRGGSWAHGAELIRSANRSQENPNSKRNILGFRLALNGNRQQIDNMLKNTAEAKPVKNIVEPKSEKNTAETKSNPVQAKTPEVKYSEPFLQKISGKTDKIYKNEKGFWEAVFLKNITMIHIPEGQFTIGSPEGEGDADEHPAHKVFLSGYWIGKTEVTFAQYDAFCQETGLAKPQDEGWGRGERPVINVSWMEAKKFCAWLEKKTGVAFRLPTEAEWERAARDRYPWGNTPPANNLANFGKAIMKTNTVGSYPEGASYYGVMDLAGNVWEWLADWYAADYYNNSAENNPQGPENGTEKVVRGGSWAHGAELIRSANRSQENPNSRRNILGFRLALTGN
jgi:formylglycine-generating enzyme required for sulfatase activity